MPTNDSNTAVQIGNGAQFKQMEDGPQSNKHLEFQKEKRQVYIFNNIFFYYLTNLVAPWSPQPQVEKHCLNKPGRGH